MPKSYPGNSRELCVKGAIGVYVIESPDNVFLTSVTFSIFAKAQCLPVPEKISQLASS